MRLVDLHCHLDLYPDFEELVKECEREAIYTLAVTTTPKAWARNKALADRTKHVRVGLGLHPQLAATHASEIALWERLLHEATYVGEVGLDASPQYAKSLPEQKRVFERVLKACSKQGGKVLSIHAVRTASTVLDMIEEHLDLASNVPVLHWFSGSLSEARRASALGCMFSINARMMDSPKAAGLVKAIPREQMLTETDGPFTQTKEAPSRPRDVVTCVRMLALALGIEQDEVAATVYENFRRIIGKTTQRVDKG